MTASTPRPKLRSAYRVPDFLVDTLHLHFDLREEHVTVRARMAVRRNPAAARPGAPLRLDGEGLFLYWLLPPSIFYPDSSLCTRT
jgi:aminopeptidase N